MFNNPFKKEQKNLLPAPFQAGTKENNIASQLIGAGKAIAEILFGVAGTYWGLCHLNEEVKKGKK